MKLRETFEVDQPVATVWRFFEQPESVAGCMPGVEQLTAVSSDDIEVRVTQSVGPMRATFAATIKIVERVPEKLISFTATGKSVGGAVGNVRATANVQLEPAARGTLVLVDGDVALAGALGSVGQKVVAKQVGKVTTQFARNLEVALGGGPAAAPSEPRTPGTLAPSGSPYPESVSGTAGRLGMPPPEGRPGGDPWAKVAAALSAVSVVLAVVALRRGSRPGTRRGRR
ncbi:CoxG family protein [Pseudonocardia kunmingensis]|uniref:Carbon monoxide dehydrogenase subunit G n=1 Tax=Pseudonocardia kunmingensis TaxID=630975 RepID=A0A543DVQ1_9PSEU|nr:SRPBCC domain-containing protein [Pseudonocardia kunmingensis]TQM13406.1 carbon monoxide dehydrogenase subunit G [Pseudonocardia kunmingensis]